MTSARVAADLMDKRSGIYSSRPRFVVVGELMCVRAFLALPA